MTIDDYVNNLKNSFKKVKDYISAPEKLDEMVDYGIKHYLSQEIKDDLFRNKSEEQKREIYDSIKQSMLEKMLDYKETLDKLSLKIAKAPGLAAVLNSIYHTARGTPLPLMIYFQWGLTTTQALAELPAMYSYLKKSHDIYGTTKWILYKAAAYALPIIGPIIDYRSASRIIKKQIIKEGVRSWLKEQKKFKEEKPLAQRIREHIDKVIGNRKPLSTPVPA